MSSILIGIPCLKIGGTEIQTLRLVEALVQKGHQCITVCYFEYDFTMVQLYEQAGSKVICLSAYGRRPESQYKTFKFLKTGLNRVVNEFKPHIAWVQYMAPGAMPIIILHRLGIKNIIATLHTDADIYKSLKLLHLLQHFCVRVFTCVTQKAEKNFFGSSILYNGSNQLKKHSHITIPNCLASNFKFSEPNTKNIGQHHSIGFVARLEEIKGADFVIPAFGLVIKQMPECKIVIVGDGKLRQAMEAQQKQHNIPTENIEWAGRVDYWRLADYYAKMDLVWVPSRSEGFGLSAIEAMGYGCPVVASQIGGLSEIVHNDIDGMHIMVGDYQALASKSLSLLCNPSKLNEMSNAAICTAKQFGFENYKERVAKLIDSFPVN